MARTKQHWTGTVTGVGGLNWVAPVHAETESSNHYGNVPALDCTGPDGRTWFVTFETRSSATTRDEYIRRMRAVAETLLAEADRMEADPKR